jgi:hypothetical protein
MTFQGYRNGMKTSAIGAAKRERAILPHRAANLPPGWPVQYVPEEKSKKYDTYFREMVEDAAYKLGWKTSHSHLPFFDTAGIPDLFLLNPRKGRMIFRELKVTSRSGKVGKPTPDQERWLVDIIACGGDAKVWTYPFDWFSGLIERELIDG